MNPASALASNPYGNSGFSYRSVVRVFCTGEPRAIEFLIKRGWKIISPRKTPNGDKPHYAFGFTKSDSLPDALADMEEARRLTSREQKCGMLRRLLFFPVRILRAISSRVLGTRSSDLPRPQRPA